MIHDFWQIVKYAHFSILFFFFSLFHVSTEQALATAKTVKQSLK